MRRSGRIGSMLFVAEIARGATAGALEPAAPAPVVWFRSSDGCPDGDAFLARLRGAAAAARLARIEDRVDFVVTMGSDGRRSFGRLEKQTASGTVAVREIAADDCGEVADALALTLTLTAEPQRAVPAEPSETRDQPPAQTASALPAPATADAATRQPAPVTGAGGSASVRNRRLDTGTRAPERAGSARVARSVWTLGAQGGAISGLGPAVGPLAAAFVDWEPNLSFSGSASVRLTGFGTYTSDGAGAAVNTTLVAARAEVCPLELVAASLRVEPCVGADAGGIRARGLGARGRAETGPWAAVVTHPRFSWELTRQLSLELQAGIFVPLIRYRLGVEGSQVDVHRLARVGFSGAAGVALRPW